MWEEEVRLIKNKCGLPNSEHTCLASKILLGEPKSHDFVNCVSLYSNLICISFCEIMLSLIITCKHVLGISNLAIQLRGFQLVINKWGEIMWLITVMHVIYVWDAGKKNLFKDCAEQKNR